MNGLTLYGLSAVTLMLVFYALERRSYWFVLAFSGSCVLASAYGFMQGVWPFGLVEAVWSVVALRRWWIERPHREMTVWDFVGYPHFGRGARSTRRRAARHSAPQRKARFRSPAASAPQL